MPDRSTLLQRRCWADIVVLVAAVYLFLAAVGSPLELLSGGGGEAVADLEHLTALGPMSLGIPGIAMLLAASSAPCRRERGSDAACKNPSYQRFCTIKVYIMHIMRSKMGTLRSGLKP